MDVIAATCHQGVIRSAAPIAAMEAPAAMPTTPIRRAIVVTGACMHPVATGPHMAAPIPAPVARCPHIPDTWWWYTFKAWWWRRDTDSHADRNLRRGWRRNHCASEGQAESGEQGQLERRAFHRWSPSLGRKTRLAVEGNDMYRNLLTNGDRPVQSTASLTATTRSRTAAGSPGRREESWQKKASGEESRQRHKGKSTTARSPVAATGSGYF